MTPERAREILEAGRIDGQYSSRMTPTELAESDRIWVRLQRSASYLEVLTLIARGEMK